MCYRRNQAKHKYYSEDKVENGFNQSKLLLKESSKLYNFGINKQFGDQWLKKETYQEDQYDIITRRRVGNLSIAEKKLHDKILNHKKEAIKYILDRVRDDTGIFIFNKDQIKTGYPCLMVNLNHRYASHEEMIIRGTMNEYDAAYPEFLTHLLIAHINFQLYNKKIGVFFERRQSFGFLIPTATDAGPAIRLSIGLVPNEEWLNAVIAGINTFELNVECLWEDKDSKFGRKAEKGLTMKAPFNFFNNSNTSIYAHKIFFNMLINTKEITEKNIKKIKYERIYEFLVAKNNEWEVNFGFDESLKNFTAESEGELEFNKLYNEIRNVYLILLEKPEKNNLNQVNIDSRNTSLVSAHQNLQHLEILIHEYQKRSFEKFKELVEIEVTSDSDTESGPISKFYTPSGMSALYAAIEAYYEATRTDNKTVYYAAKNYVYFEIDTPAGGGWKGKFRKNVKYVNLNSIDANIIFIDNNPCLNGAYLLEEIEKEAGVKEIKTIKAKTKYSAIQDCISEFGQKIQNFPEDLKTKAEDLKTEAINFLSKRAKNLIKEQKVEELKEPDFIDTATFIEGLAITDNLCVLVVDVTSSTQEQIMNIIEVWNRKAIPILMLASSPLKNRQLSLDMAQYGEIRLYTQNKTDNFIENFKKSLRNVTKCSSSAYATMVRRDMRQAINDFNKNKK